MAKYFKKIKTNNPKVVVLEFKAHIPMALMFMRLQEYTEGIKATRGNILPEGTSLLYYYKKRKTIWYKDGWAGFNLRGDILKEIFQKYYFWTAWNDLEQELWKIRREMSGKYGTDYFIISYTKGDKTTLKHEWHHAMYYLNPTYRWQVDKILANENLKKAGKYLKSLGYSLKGDRGRYIFLDEIQAYLSENDKATTKLLGIRKKTYKKLRKLSKRYCRMVKE